MFLYFIYCSRRCLNMSKSLKTNDLSLSCFRPTHQNSRIAEVKFVFTLRFKTSGGFVCTKRLNGRTTRRFVSILISSALAYTDSEMELNRILFSCLERKCLRGELRRVLDHSFNVCLGVSGGEMELTRMCCFEFDRMLRADSKRVLLSTC